MKIFISSLIAGFAPFRDAARQAVLELNHEPVMAEDFGARPTSPQVACLDGLRNSGLVVLMLGEAYGTKQASGVSATHEEYREARDTKPVIAFVQEGVIRDADEAAFVTEVQGWSGGLFRGGFTTPDQLRGKIVRGIHEHELARASGPVNAEALLKAAVDLLPGQQRGYSSTDRHLSLAVAYGPEQAILRPSAIESPVLAERLEQLALFGPTQVFDRSNGSQHRIDRGQLVLFQSRDTEIRLHPQGHLRLTLSLPRERDAFGGVIEEDIAEVLSRGLTFAAAAIDHIDTTHRLTHVSLATSLSDAQFMAWRTRAEQASNSRSIIYGTEMGRKAAPVHLTPPVRPRAAVTHDRQALVEDLVTLLRREYRHNA